MVSFCNKAKSCIFYDFPLYPKAMINENYRILGGKKNFEPKL